jgi:hypothetical protein
MDRKEYIGFMDGAGELGEDAAASSQYFQR